MSSIGLTSQIVISLIASVWLVACSAQTASEPNNSSESNPADAEPKQLYQQIQQLLESNQCATDSDCGLLGIGARPCGGPDDYLVYSKKSTDGKKLRALTGQYNQLIKNINREQGRLGICVVAPKPMFSCANQRCEASFIAANDSETQ